MNRQQVIVALLQGVLFAVLMWVGDEFFLEDEKTSYIYIIEGAVFAVAMFFATIISLFYIINNLTGGVARKSIEVPAVAGLEYTTDAELGLGEDFVVSVEYVHSSTIAAGTIISQEPSGRVPYLCWGKISSQPQ